MGINNLRDRIVGRKRKLPVKHLSNILGFVRKNLGSLMQGKTLMSNLEFLDCIPVLIIPF